MADTLTGEEAHVDEVFGKTNARSKQTATP